MRSFFSMAFGLLLSTTVSAQTPAYAWAKFAGDVGGQQASGRTIATDPQGNVFVAGVGAPSITWGSIALTACQQYLMKANSAGTVLWAKKIPMLPDHLATDSEGNLYVSCSAQGTIDLDGTTIPGDLSIPSVLLVKYDPMGNVLWFRNHAPSSGQVSPGRVTTDAADNVYLCGAFNTSITIDGITYTGNPANGSAVFAVSYTSDGTYRRSNATTSLPPLTSLNVTVAAACDTSCAIVRGGPFGGVDQIQIGAFTLTVTSEQTPAYNAYLAKWAPDGTVAWAQASGGAGTEDITDVVIDGNGQVIVSGGFTATFMDHDSATMFGRRLFLQSQSYNLMDMYVASFAPEGALQWIKRGGGNHIDAGADLEVDALNNVYAYGSGQSGLMTFDDLTVYPYSGSYLVKFARTGDVRWAKLMAAGAGGGNNCFDAAADMDGNVYVTGMQSDTIRLDAFQNITPAPNNFDVFVARLNDCSRTSSVLSASGPLSFCPGDSVTLSVPQAADHTWNTGELTANITVHSQGDHWAVTANAAGCITWSDTLSVALYTPQIPVATLTSGLLNSTPATTYQWTLDGDEIPGATAQTFDPDVQGTYAVITTDVNGCTSISATVFFSTVGISEQALPMDRVIQQGGGSITVVLAAPVEALSILNVLGQEVWRSAQPSSTSVDVFIPLSGVHFLRAVRGGEMVVHRFVVAR